MNQHLCKHMHVLIVQHPELLEVTPGISEEDRREEILQISQLHEMSAPPVIADVVTPNPIEVKGVEIPNPGPAESWTRDEQWTFIQSYNAANHSLTDVCNVILSNLGARPRYPPHNQKLPRQTYFPGKHS